MRKYIYTVLLSAAATMSAVVLYSGNSKKIGQITAVDPGSKEITVSVEGGEGRVKMGDSLCVYVDGCPAIMKAIFPMMTLARCRLDDASAKLLNKLKNGMDVFIYDTPVPEKNGHEQAAVTPGKVIKYGKVEMVFIRGGEFMMGSPESEMDRNGDEFLHSVRVSDFWMGKYEVTIEVYREIMKDKYNPEQDDGDGDQQYTEEHKPVNGKCPVTYIGWDDAVEFCNRLSKLYNLKPCYTISQVKDDRGYYGINFAVICNFKANGFRLPTEAEWEYACRAGTVAAYNTGADIDQGMANFGKEYDDENLMPAGSFRPNRFGLYDMHGNAAEFCWDWYKKDYYSESPHKDPAGPDTPDDYSFKVFRGGGWISTTAEIRSAARPDWFPEGPEGGANCFIGFRLCRSVSE